MKRALVGVLVALILLGLAASIAVPLWVRARKRSRLAKCSTNLGQLWKLQCVQKAQFGRRPFIRSPGKEFWLALSRTSPPLIEAGDWDIYGCPLRGGCAIGQTHYLGPPVDVNTLTDSDAVGCDELWNHSIDGAAGGNLLRKAGDVMELPGPEWVLFHRDSRCKP